MPSESRPLDEQRSRIFEDLRGLLGCELQFAPLARASYRYDAGLYETDPLGVVSPRTEAELVALIRYASDHNIPIHPRGGGTGRSGGALGSGLLVDLSRHFRHAHFDGSRAIVQAGAVYHALRLLLAEHGRQIAIEPDCPEASTIGGLIGRDAVGPRSHHAGSMGDQLLALRGVLSDGEVVELVPTTIAPDTAEDTDPLSRLTNRLGMMVNRLGESLLARQGRQNPDGCPRLDAILARSRVDLPKLIAGSSGSLLIITEATLKTELSPSHQALVVLAFSRLVDAAQAGNTIMPSAPDSCELFDGRAITLARESSPLLRELPIDPCQGLLVVGFSGHDLSRVQDSVRRLADRFSDWPGLVSEPVEVTAQTQVNSLLNLRRLVDQSLAVQVGAARPVEPLGWIQVTPSALPSLVLRLQNLMRQTGVSATIEAHACLGHVRFRPFLDLTEESGRSMVDRLANEVLELTLSLGGSAALGRRPDRIPWLKRFLGENLNSIRELKYAFDPKNLLNPEILASSESSIQSTRLRPLPTAKATDKLLLTSQVGSMVLNWREKSRTDHLSACNNCGSCRGQDPGLRMCPVFRATKAEAAAPRSKVNTLRQVASGAIDPREWGSDDFRAQAELCVHCKLCEKECPSGVDVSALMLEAKAAYVAIHGLTPEDWMLGRIDKWAGLASRFPRLFNRWISNGPLRWVLQRAFGLSALRQFPQTQGEAFLRRAERAGLAIPRPHEPGPRVALFLDIFANHFDQELAECLVSLFQHLGVNLYIPAGQKGCGMPALVTGDIDRARDMVRSNLRILGNAVREGYTVVTAEPTALLMYKKESARLTDDLDAPLVAQNMMDAGEYLAGLLAFPNTPRPETSVPVRVGYHQPCHLRALDIGTPGLDLMRFIPGAEVELLDRGCSGMAGISGYRSVTSEIH